MINGMRVVAVTPAGRRDNMEVLAPYVFRDKGIIDEWMIWVNTPKHADVDLCKNLEKIGNGFVRLVWHDRKIPRPQPQPPFFRNTIDRDAVYVKFDDDICWVAPDAVKRLVDFRMENPDYFVVMSNIVCNGFCAAIHQRNGSMSFKIGGEIVRMDRHYDNKLYRSPRIAEYVHRTFIEDLLNGELERYRFPEYPLDNYENFSINCMAWFGSDFADFDGLVEGDDEERWICSIKSREIGRKNCVCGDSLVAHHAFYTHRKPFCGDIPEIDARILDAYRMIARRVATDDLARHLFGGDPIRSDDAIRNILRARVML